MDRRGDVKNLKGSTEICKMIGTEISKRNWHSKWLLSTTRIEEEERKGISCRVQKETGSPLGFLFILREGEVVRTSEQGLYRS